jgi:hypothetical protein
MTVTWADLFERAPERRREQVSEALAARRDDD